MNFDSHHVAMLDFHQLLLSVSLYQTLQSQSI